MSPSPHPDCAAPDGRGDDSRTGRLPAQPDRLYRNNGDGTFADVSGSSGIARPEGRGLGVLIAELTGDNRPDIFVANDGTPCWLLANRGDLRFEDIAEASGVARDGQGRAIAGMGVALADLDGDGRSDLVVTNFIDRSTIAFQAEARPGGNYRDASARLGLIATTRRALGFGVALTDFDGDGQVDLLQANGHVLDRGRGSAPHSRCARHCCTIPASGSSTSRAGPDLGSHRPVLGRGVAVGDLDGDGRPDAVVNALDAPAALLANDSTGGRFLDLEVIDRRGGRPCGARVRVTAGGRTRAGELFAGGSYLSASEQRVRFGLGGVEGIDRIEVDWPEGGRSPGLGRRRRRTDRWGSSRVQAGRSHDPGDANAADQDAISHPDLTSKETAS